MKTARKLEGVVLEPIKVILRLALITFMAIPSTLLAVAVLSLLLAMLPIEPRSDNGIRAIAISMVTMIFVGPGFFTSALIIYDQLVETSRLTKRDVLRATLCGGGLTLFSFVVSRIWFPADSFTAQLFWYIPAFPIAVAAETFKRPQVGDGWGGA